MVSDYQKKKRNAYGMYIADRIKGTGIPYAEAFQNATWREDWKVSHQSLLVLKSKIILKLWNKTHSYQVLSEEQKEDFKERAKVYNERLKVICDQVKATHIPPPPKKY